MCVDIHGEGEMDLHRSPAHAFADRHGQHRGVPCDHLAGPVDEHVPVLHGEFGPAGVPLAGLALAESVGTPVPPTDFGSVQVLATGTRVKYVMPRMLR